MEDRWFWTGFIAMVAGAAIFLLYALVLRREDRHHALLAFAVAFIGMAAYYALVTAFGRFWSDDHPVYLPRFIDWAITAPLLLISLLMIGVHPLISPDKARSRLTAWGTIVGAAILMVLTSLFAVLNQGTERLVWFILSCLTLVGVLVGIWGYGLWPAHRAGLAARRLYSLLAAILTTLLISYFVVGALGGAGAERLALDTENTAYTVLDISSHVLFNLILVGGIIQMTRRVRPTYDESVIEASARVSRTRHKI